MSGSIGKLLDPAGVIIKDKPKAQAPSAPAAPVADAAEKGKTEQVALREQMMGRAAAGASIAGSDNEADQLGSTIKRRSASKALLGS